jgi:DNA-binding transcriptional ArsR family regulator
MEDVQVIRALAALAHDSRLRVFRLLAKAGDEGVAAGKIAEQLSIPGTTLSFHLKELSNADLVEDRRAGRSVIYAINRCTLKCFVDFLLEDCCNGHPSLCGPARKRRATRSNRTAKP